MEFSCITLARRRNYFLPPSPWPDQARVRFLLTVFHQRSRETATMLARAFALAAPTSNPSKVVISRLEWGERAEPLQGR